MRSRYSAFAVSNSKYILQTTHKENPDFTTDTTKWLQEIDTFSKNTSFNKLEIMEFIDGEDMAFVTFRATLYNNGEDISFTEKSKFYKVNGSWLYHSGEFL